MTPIINSRADLNALRGTDVYSDALRAILGATTTWVNDAPEGAAPQWRQVSVGETLAHLDLTLDELLAECASAGIAPTNPPAPSSVAITPPTPEIISKRQFAHGLAKKGFITETEALAWVSRGDLPAAILSLIASLPAAEKFDAEIILKGASEFRRSHPLTESFGAATGCTPEEIDDLWRFCAGL